MNYLKKLKKNDPNDAWKGLGILNKYEGKKISGLNNNVTSVILEELNTLACTPNDWDDKELSEEIQLIRRHMKKDYENEIRINIGENGELKHD
ncbi:1425_t:CDS:2, partial [Entrophospora sp. SA101]